MMVTFYMACIIKLKRKEIDGKGKTKEKRAVV